jgi:nucleoside-diphosphate-sugar epimerase
VVTVAAYQSKYALVWGARGFIGRALVAHLRANGWRVRALTRALDGPPPSWGADIEWIELAPDRARAFDRAVDGVSVVFNLAGSSGAVASNRDPIESLESNCRLQLEFLAACERSALPVRVVFASSRLVYGPAGLNAVSEQSPIRPLSIYAAHKLSVEHYHQIASQRGRISYTICRVSNPYGVDTDPCGKGYGFINALIQRARTGQVMRLFGDGGQLRDYIHLDDLTTMLRLTAERGAARNVVLNVGYGGSLTVRDAAHEIQDVFRGGAIEFRPWPAEYEAVESGDFVMDTSRAKAILGYSPRYDFSAGLRAVRDSYTPSLSKEAPTAARAAATVALSNG